MRKSSRGNPWHDERGRFCSGPKGNSPYTVSEKSPEEYEAQTKQRIIERINKPGEGYIIEEFDEPKYSYGEKYTCQCTILGDLPGTARGARMFTSTDEAMRFADAYKEIISNLNEPEDLMPWNRKQTAAKIQAIYGAHNIKLDGDNLAFWMMNEHWHKVEPGDLKNKKITAVYSNLVDGVTGIGYSKADIDTDLESINALIDKHDIGMSSSVSLEIDDYGNLLIQRTFRPDYY